MSLTKTAEHNKLCKKILFIVISLGVKFMECVIFNWNIKFNFLFFINLILIFFNNFIFIYLFIIKIS